MLTVQEEVFCHIKRVDHRQRLMNGLDAQLSCVARRADAVLCPPDEDTARIGLVKAGDALHQRRFSGAVIAQQGGDSTVLQLNGHIVEGLNRPKCLRDARGNQCRGVVHRVPFHETGLPSTSQTPATEGLPEPTPATPTTNALVTKAWIRKPKTTVSPSPTMRPDSGLSLA